MAKEIDVNAAISALVAEAVSETLEPYRDLLNRMATLLGAPASAPAKRNVATEAAAAPAPKRKDGKRRGRKAAGAAAAAPVTLAVGQAVTYKQGRGAFEAKVLEIVGDRVTLERAKDGKKVVRPAAKVAAA